MGQDFLDIQYVLIIGDYSSVLHHGGHRVRPPGDRRALYSVQMYEVPHSKGKFIENSVVTYSSHHVITSGLCIQI